MYVRQWVDELQMCGRYSFTRADVIAGTKRSREAVKKALQRLIESGRIARIKDSFFVIVPLEYAVVGAPPPSWFVDQLMANIGQPYYVGLLSAAALHGASHHSPQVFQVVTDRSVRPVAAGRVHFRFFASKFTNKVSTQQVKTPTGSMQVSTPEATALDLVRFVKSCGNLDHVGTVLAELSENLVGEKLVAAARVIGDVPNAQRLGYLLEHVGRHRLAAPLHHWVRAQHPRLVPLCTTLASTHAPTDCRWSTLINHQLEIEA